MCNFMAKDLIVFSFKLCVCLLLYACVLKVSQAKSIAPSNFIGIQNHKMQVQEMTWLKAMQLLRQDIKACEKLAQTTTWHCFKQSSMHLFDSLMSAEVIYISKGVRFVRQDNVTNNKYNFDDLERKDFQHLTWFDYITIRIAKILSTHVLQVNLKELTDKYIEMEEHKAAVSNQKIGDTIGTARIRRHRYNMMITMMFGATALGAILIPMGFQLLSIVSGKALLLAKMALLLASINGLKRVATSGVHYGLYHVPGEHLGGYYDRGDSQRPRNVLTIPMPHMPEPGLSF